MEKLIQLFLSADIYYNYAEGNAYYRGKDSCDNFLNEYKQLTTEQKLEFYHQIKEKEDKVKFFSLITE